jgi:aminomethyltransferase
MPEVALHSKHQALGAKMGPFGGWDMPIEYSAGTVAEHTAVRTAVGVFDVSHMGKVRILGEGAYAFANSVFANDLARIQPGQAQYSMLCNDSGGIIDDLIVYLVSDTEIRFIPNAGNASTVVAELEKVLPVGLTIENNHLNQGILAVQGPKSGELLDALGLPNQHGYMEFEDAIWNGYPLTVCRTGYTGEQGYELVIGNEGLPALFDAIFETGKRFGILPCGLGARDTLRTEMGYPLHGQDISAEITPLEAKIGWAIGWTKENFSGRTELVKQKEIGVKRVAVGLLANDRGIPRGHMDVKDVDGNVIGETTSGTFSPTLQKGIALALVKPEVAVGDLLIVDVRGRALSVTVVKPPFVKPSTK